MDRFSLGLLLLVIVVGLAVSMVLLRWRLIRYLERATLFVPHKVSPETEYSFVCECGEPLTVEHSLAGNRARCVCSCGNAWVWRHVDGHSYLNDCVDLFNNGLVRVNGRKPERRATEEPAPHWPTANPPLELTRKFSPENPRPEIKELVEESEASGT